MQIRPVLCFVPVLCLSAGAWYLTSHDLQVQQALIAQQIQSQPQRDRYIEVDPNYLFYPEITYAWQDGNRAVVTICQKAESALSAPNQTLYLRAGNGQKSAAYFPYMSGTDAVWSYASFDDTSWKMPGKPSWNTAPCGSRISPWRMMQRSGMPNGNRKEMSSKAGCPPMPFA